MPLHLVKNMPDLIETVNEELCKLCTWLSSNKLSLNVKKTHFMVFKTKNKRIPRVSNSITIGNEEIKQVECTKFLGVYIDEKLSWNTHVKNVKNKLSKGAGIMYKAKSLVNDSTLMTIYYSFVYPYLYYGIIAWGNTYDYLLDSINTVHKRIIRIMASARKYAHTDPFFKEFKLLRLQQIYILNCAVFMFKRYYKNLPECFDEMYLLNRDVHTYDTRQVHLFHSPKWKLDIMRRSI